MNSVPSGLIIDAMCIVNMVSKTPDILNAKNFARKFVDIVAGMSTCHNEIRVVFDQYLPGSPKEKTRDKLTPKATPVHHHVNDDTKITSLKDFLAHINSKAEMTKYLGDKLISYHQGKSQKVIVMYHTNMKANWSLSDVVSMPEMAAGKRSLEEGDQLVILNAFDVMHKDPCSRLDVLLVDTDVFVLQPGH